MHRVDTTGGERSVEAARSACGNGQDHTSALQAREGSYDHHRHPAL
jgi:hypothetical protein